MLVFVRCYTWKTVLTQLITRYGVTPVCADNSVKHNCYIALFLGGKELYYQLAQNVDLNF